MLKHSVGDVWRRPFGETANMCGDPKSRDIPYRNSVLKDVRLAGGLNLKNRLLARDPGTCVFQSISAAERVEPKVHTAGTDKVWLPKTSASQPILIVAGSPRKWDDRPRPVTPP